MEQAGARARYERLHKEAPYHDGSFSSWAKERTNSHPYGMFDGVTIWVADRDLTPDDKFLSPHRQGDAGDAETTTSD